MFLRCKLINKLSFWKRNIQQKGTIQKQFHLKTCGVFEFPVQNLIYGKKIWFKIWHALEIPIQKLPSFLKLGEITTRFQNLDSERERFWKSCLKIWSFWKVLIRNLFFLNYSTYSWFLRGRITAKIGAFTC